MLFWCCYSYECSQLLSFKKQAWFRLNRRHQTQRLVCATKENTVTGWRPSIVLLELITLTTALGARLAVFHVLLATAVPTLQPQIRLLTAKSAQQAIIVQPEREIASPFLAKVIITCSNFPRLNLKCLCGCIENAFSFTNAATWWVVSCIRAVMTNGRVIELDNDCVVVPLGKMLCASRSGHFEECLNTSCSLVNNQSL